MPGPTTLLRTTALAILATAVGTVALLPEADACDPGFEQVMWSLPANLDSIPEDGPILVAIGGDLWTGTREIILTREEQEVAANLERRYSFGLFASVHELVPEEPLEPGTHTLDITYSETDNMETEDFTATFTVDPSFALADLPGPVEFEWYRETFEENTGDSCYYAQEMQFLRIQPLDEEPHFYEVIIHREDNDSPSITLRLPAQINGDIVPYSVPQATCIEVRGIRADGEAGESVEFCEPHKAVYIDNTGGDYIGFGETDWDNVNEGGGCVCSTTSKTPPAEFLLVLAALGLFTLRRG